VWKSLIAAPRAAFPPEINLQQLMRQTMNAHSDDAMNQNQPCSGRLAFTQARREIHGGNTKPSVVWRWACLFPALAGVGFIAADANGQTITRTGSGVEARFASQSDAYQDSDPTGLTPFSPVGPGLYPGSAPLPGLPAAPVASIIPPGGNPFANGGWSSLFNDGAPNPTKAQSVIDDFISATPTVTSDIRIAIPGWRLFQVPTATGYAYEQLNFGTNYLFTFNPGLGASAAPALPVFINGSVVGGPGTYVQFDGLINYTWLPVSVNTAGVVTPAGAPVPLGTLSYAFTQLGGGPFNQTLTSSGSLLATPIGDGILALDGHMWIAGDPFDFNVTTVPEPASVGMLGMGALTLAICRRRKG
jgi:hypothetical protein